MPDLQPIAERINTGTENPNTSRALVVFNLTVSPQSGVAVFRASMSWPRDVSLLPVSVADTDGAVVPSAVREMQEGPDARGRTDRVQLLFSLCFAATDVPANGWRTYIASYTNAPTLVLEDFVEMPGLVVVETTRHGGDLATLGTYPVSFLATPPATGRVGV